MLDDFLPEMTISLTPKLLQCKPILIILREYLRDLRNSGLVST